MTLTVIPRQEECIKWVLAASRDKQHCICINQYGLSPTADMTHKMVCSITAKQPDSRKGPSSLKSEHQEVPANTREHLLFARRYARHLTRSIYSVAAVCQTQLVPAHKGISLFVSLHRSTFDAITWVA